MKKLISTVTILSFLVFMLPVSAASDSHLGKIFLQVEENGEAWYVVPEDGTRYYLQNGHYAYDALRLFGLGISNADIWKIPVGVSDTLNENISLDSDQDGLRDSLESALGTSGTDADADNDGYSDYTEYINGYNPFGEGTIPIDAGLADRLKGYILLQVESQGQAWYVNPADGKRYYMENGQVAYDLMRYFSVGITNADLEMIPTHIGSPELPSEEWSEYVYSNEIFVFSIDFPSYSYVTTDDNTVTATVLDGQSYIRAQWNEGSQSVQDVLGSTADDVDCMSMSYGGFEGIGCNGVTHSGLNAFIFEAEGYTFSIIDMNANRLSDFPLSEWVHVLGSVSVTEFMYE